MNRRYSSGSPFEPIIGFSRAVRIGNRVEVAGTVALDANGELVGPGDPEAQADRCLQIIVEAIEALGLSRTDVIRTRTYLVRAEDWEAVGRAHGRVFRMFVRPAPWSWQPGFSRPNGWSRSKRPPKVAKSKWPYRDAGEEWTVG